VIAPPVATRNPEPADRIHFEFEIGLRPKHTSALQWYLTRFDSV
jgi:hypothetical protein